MIDAFDRLVAAINAPSDRALLERAVTPTVHVDRHQPGDAAIAEQLDGIDAVARWFARTPENCVFGLADAPRDLADGRCEVTYTISAGEFTNRGLWTATLDDGRIAALAHYPFSL